VLGWTWKGSSDGIVYSDCRGMWGNVSDVDTSASCWHSSV